MKSLGPARLPPPPALPLARKAAGSALGSSETEYVEEVLLPLGSGLGEKEYRCKVCGKVSKFKGNLVRHMLVHTGERNFSCRYGCGACYKNSWNMKKHEVKCRNNPMVHWEEEDLEVHLSRYKKKLKESPKLNIHLSLCLCKNVHWALSLSVVELLCLWENNKCMWKNALCLDWMEYGRYHLISDVCSTKICKDSSVLGQVIQHTVHFNLSGSGWTVESGISIMTPKLVHISFRWTLPRMRDRVTSKRLTASGYSLIYDSQYYCQIPTINMVCEENVTSSTWSSNIQGMWRLTFYPRNPYEATGMVKRPWDQQVFFLSNANTQMFISFIKIFYFNCP